MSRTAPLCATIETEGENLTTKGLLKRDRYVATNRFAVRKGKGAKFEARWANRKSRLSELQGFKYFHLSEYVYVYVYATQHTLHGVVNLRAIHPFETIPIFNCPSNSVFALNISVRRVDIDEDGTNRYDEGEKADGTNMGNYVSFTIWDKKSDFSAWRKGDAFKEVSTLNNLSYKLKKIQRKNTDLTTFDRLTGEQALVLL